MSDDPSPAGPERIDSGMFGRLARSLRSRLVGAPASAAAHAVGPEAAAAEPASHPLLHPLLRPHAAKLCSAAEAVSHVRHGDHVWVGSACATPRELVAALEAVDYGVSDVELLHFLTDHAVPHDAAGRAATRFRHRSFFVGADLQAALQQGLADYVPLSLARLPGLIAIGRVKVDVALIQVSLPDAFGFVSFGVSVDATPAAVRQARLVIAEVNPLMPRTMGDSMLHVDRIHHLVPVATPVIEYTHPPVSDQALQQIARYIASIIEDGSTLQIGMGRVASEALRHLGDRIDLGIHSDVITDALIPLIEKGIVSGRKKSLQPGRIVTSFAMGSRRLYDLVDGNPLFSFQPIEVVAAPQTVAAQHRMVSITQAFAIDLSGQVCADRLGGRTYGGLAAQAEFMRGASRSVGGKPIICLASTTDDSGTPASNIRLHLQPGEAATVPRSDVHYVITEYGIAHLFGKSLRERAVALIAVAHPQFRAALFEQAQAAGLVPADQTLANLKAYPVEEERPAALKDGRQVLLRPAVASDGVAVRDLFHRLSDRDVYTRFFRKIRGLSDRDVQRLCNLDFENEVAFVAVAGAREDAQVVAQACYFLDPSTNIAETAFMVHPDWRHVGLGAVLQQRMAEHAQGRGVRGFVAEIMASNDAMIGLGRASKGQVSVTSEDGQVRVTTLFTGAHAP